MARFKDTVPSSRSPEDTFDYLARFSSVSEWDPGAPESEDLTNGAPVAVGSKFRVVTQFGRARNELVYEVVEYDRPRRVRLLADGPTFVSDDLIEVAPTGESASVTYTADLQMKGLWKAIDPVMKVLFGRVGGRAAEGLKRELARPAA